MVAAMASSVRTSVVGFAASQLRGGMDRSLPAGSASVGSRQPRQVHYVKAISVHATRLVTKEVHSILHPQSPTQPSVCSIRASWAPPWLCNHLPLAKVWVAAQEDAWLLKPTAAIS